VELGYNRDRAWYGFGVAFFELEKTHSASRTSSMKKRMPQFEGISDQQL
jgi:hypothetical protein